MEVKETAHIGDYAAVQSITEIGLGSLLHALHIPFAGHFLSLNQAVLLTLASKKVDSIKAAMQTSIAISVIAATLKSLSPMGKRLTPMLAISVQGLLFSFGFVFGRNIVGVSVGMILLSLWGFIQPLLFAYLVFGEKLFFALQKLWIGFAETFSIDYKYGAWLLVTVVISKLLIAVLVGIFVWRSKAEFEIKYLTKIRNIKIASVGKKKLHPVIGAMKDSLSPWILISLILSVSFMWLNEHSSFFEIWIYSLRALALAWLCFWIIRSFPLAWADRLLKKYPAARRAVDQVFNFKSRK